MLAGGNEAWRAAGLPLVAGEDGLEAEPVDAHLRAYDCTTNVEEAMQAYLDWEVDLINRLDEDGTLPFRAGLLRAGGAHMPVRGPERVLLGLIGAGIQASRAPALHEAAGAALGRQVFYHLIDAQTLGFDTADLPRLLDAVRWAGFAGVNVTHPFKEAVLPLLDEVDPTAARIGAVNTVTVRGRRPRGQHRHARLRPGLRQTFERRPRHRGAARRRGCRARDRPCAGGLGARRVVVHDVVAGRAEAVAQALGASAGRSLCPQCAGGGGGYLRTGSSTPRRSACTAIRARRCRPPGFAPACGSPMRSIRRARRR